MKKTAPFFCLIFLFLSACSSKSPPPFADLTYSDQFTSISAPDGRSWIVSFETTKDSTFSGMVRHVSRWHETSMPFMTHDILVTTGDFASRSAVDVLVLNHKFFYHSREAFPDGSIHLLHIFPASEEIYRQLLEVKSWTNVNISGREIQQIDIFDAQGSPRGYFTDHGCNSILVKSVGVQAKGTPVP